MTLEAEVRAVRKVLAELVKVESARLDIERRLYIGMPYRATEGRLSGPPERRDPLDPTDRAPLAAAGVPA